MVIGGASLAIRGIRDAKDVDILVLPETFKKLRLTWGIDKEFHKKWGRERLRKNSVEIYNDVYIDMDKAYLDPYKLVASSEIVEGIPIQELENLLICKLDCTREKDAKDVLLIKKHIKSKKKL